MLRLHVAESFLFTCGWIVTQDSSISWSTQELHSLPGLCSHGIEMKPDGDIPSAAATYLLCSHWPPISTHELFDSLVSELSADSAGCKGRLAHSISRAVIQQRRSHIIGMSGGQLLPSDSKGDHAWDLIAYRAVGEQSHRDFFGPYPSWWLQNRPLRW